MTTLTQKSALLLCTTLFFTPTSNLNACGVQKTLVTFAAGAVVGFLGRVWCCTQTDISIVNSTRSAINTAVTIHNQQLLHKLYDAELFTEMNCYGIGLYYFSPEQPTVDGYALILQETIDNLIGYQERLTSRIDKLREEIDGNKMYRIMEQSHAHVSHVITMLTRIKTNLLDHRGFFDDFQRNYHTISALLEKTIIEQNEASTEPITHGPVQLIQ